MYAIKYDEGFKNLVIIPNATGREVPIDKTFSNEEELKKLFSGPELAALYNAVGGDSPALKVKRFATRDDGAKRTYGMISRLHPEVPVAAAPPTTSSPTDAATTILKEDDMAKNAKKKGAKASKKKERKAGPKALVRADSTRGKLLKLAVENSGEISLKAIATRAGVSGEGSMTAEARARMRLRVVAEVVGATFEVSDDGKVSFKLPAGMTLAKALGE